MMKFINIVDKLRERYRCVAVIVHHTGHSIKTKNRGRGSSAFKAAMDWEFLVDKSKSHLRATKMKDAELPPTIQFEITKVGLSAVVIFNGPAADPVPELTPAEKYALSILKGTFKRLDQQLASVEEWRKDFYLHSDDKNHRKCSRFHLNPQFSGCELLGNMLLENQIWRTFKE